MSMPESAIMMTGPDLGRRGYMARRIDAPTDNSRNGPRPWVRDTFVGVPHLGWL